MENVRINSDIREFLKLRYDSLRKAQRLRWFEHVCLMPENRHVRKVLEKDSGGKKKKVRLKKRWLDAVMTDLRRVGVYDYRSRATETDGEFL